MIKLAFSQTLHFRHVHKTKVTNEDTTFHTVSQLAIKSQESFAELCRVQEYMQKQKRASVRRKVYLDDNDNPDGDMDDDQDDMMKYVDENIIGNDIMYDGPFGVRKGNI